jgi:hypothetical protein
MMQKRTLLITAIAVIVIGISITMISLNFQIDSPEFEVMDSNTPRAAILDQLQSEIPNESFHKKVTEYLQGAGYQVDYYPTEEITVGLYKQLPSLDYDFIVIRSHSLGDGAVEPSASLFTGEKYTDHKYIKEQFLGYVGRGIPILNQELSHTGGIQAHRNNTYFVVGSKMVDELMVGNFKNTTIVLAGCETMEKSRLADSFLNKGASNVIGWNGLVDARNNDGIVLEVLKRTLVDGYEINQSVDSVMEQVKGKLIYENTTLLHHSYFDMHGA